jgi:hypothetical protein
LEAELASYGLNHAGYGPDHAGYGSDHAARLTWPLLDRAELAVTGRVERPVRWSPCVRFVRGLGEIRSRARPPAVKIRP